MNQEEKAQAYDGLIERLKDLKFAYRFSPLSDAIEEKFPELAESEDERIRNFLMMIVDKYAGVSNEEKKKCHTWLKKQGKPAEINPSEFDSQLNRLLKQFESLSKEELVNSLMFYLNIVMDGTYKEEKRSIFTFNDVLALQCVIINTNKDDEKLYNTLRNLRDKVEARCLKSIKFNDYPEREYTTS